MDIRNAVVVGCQDASFDNIEGNKSQAGKTLMLADERILDGDNNLYPVATMVWRSNTIKRVVIIIASVIAFKTPISTLGVIGSTIAIIGTLLYSLAKSKFG